MQAFARYLTRPEERALLSTVSRYACPLARRDHAWMRLALHTGLRVGTLSRLTVGDARQALSDGYLRLEPGQMKRGQAHSIYVTRPAERALKDLLRCRRELGHPGGADEALIVSRQGGALSVRSYQARMRQWCELAGLRDATPHWFRHTLAMRLMRESTARDPRGIVQAALGHRSIESTVVYTRPSREDVSQAMAEVAS